MAKKNMIQAPYVDTRLNLVIPGGNISVEKRQKRDRVFHIIGLVLTYAFIALCALVAIFPFYYMIVASFMRENVLLNGAVVPEFSSLIDDIRFNYSETLARFNYMSYVGNTLFIGFTETILQILITIITAFAFARLKFRGRDVLFTLFLATMMIPGEIMVISNNITMANLGLTGYDQNRAQAYIAIMLPFLASVFYIYLLRQNFKQIPNELYLAAKVDGKSDWEYLWKVMVPLAAPTLITIAILSFIGAWNGYIWPRIAVNASSHKEDFWTISVALRDSSKLALMDQNENLITQNSWQMVASVMTVVPLLILFIIFRKYIMRGTSRAGIKG